MRITVILIVCVLLLGLGGFVSVKLLRAPAPVLNDNDLRPAWPQVPAEQNGFSRLLAAARLLVIGESEANQLSELAKGRVWDEAQARDFLRANEAALTAMREAQVLPHLQLEAIPGHDEKFPYLKELRILTELALIEARLSFHSGDEAAAFDQSLDVIRFGQRVQAAGGSVLHYLVGGAIKVEALTCLRQLAGQSTLSSEKLLALAEELKAFEADPTSLQHALRVEYAMGVGMLEEFASNTMTNTDGTPIKAPRFLYSAKRSKLELADQIRRTMAAVTNNYATGIGQIPVADTNVSTLRLMLRGNVVGTVLNQLILPLREKLLERKCRENVSVRATRVVLALRVFQITHGRAAQSLDELLPTVLEVIPLDDFNGQSLRYSAAEKIVYAVGVDLTDSGGVPATKRSQPGDQVFKFDF